MWTRPKVRRSLQWWGQFLGGTLSTIQSTCEHVLAHPALIVNLQARRCEHVLAQCCQQPSTLQPLDHSSTNLLETCITNWVSSLDSSLPTNHNPRTHPPNHPPTQPPTHPPTQLPFLLGLPQACNTPGQPSLPFATVRAGPGCVDLSISGPVFLVLWTRDLYLPLASKAKKHQSEPPSGCGSKLKNPGYAGVSPFHLPRCRFGAVYLFLSRQVARRKKQLQTSGPTRPRN